MTIANMKTIEETATFLKSRMPYSQIDGLVILGSGLGFFAKELEEAASISYSEIPHFPRSTVVGHSGKLILGKSDKGLKIACMQGRFHYFEGHDIADITFPVRVMKQLGAKFLVVTNAAGGINPRFRAGQTMLIRDHINFMGVNPLRGAHQDGFGARFVDMTQAYDADYLKLARDVARAQNFDLAEGVYAGVSGPNYETPSEIRMLATLGADAVGMSTVPEVIVARQVGLRVLGLSMIANEAAGLSDKILDHQDVLDSAKRSEEGFVQLLDGILDRLTF
jgi:purine-nucleoside phosphorylase